MNPQKVKEGLWMTQSTVQDAFVDQEARADERF